MSSSQNTAGPRTLSNTNTPTQGAATKFTPVTQYQQWQRRPHYRDNPKHQLQLHASSSAHQAHLGPRGKPLPQGPTRPATHRTTGTGAPLDNIYGPIAEHGSGTNDRDIERLSFGSLSGASGTHSCARNSKSRDPIPLTAEILHLLDRLEQDKGKQARLLTEHLTGQRSLASSKAELLTHMERRAARELKRHRVAAEAAANTATTDQDRADHEAAMAAHIAQHAMATTLAAGATNEEALAAGVATQAAAL